MFSFKAKGGFGHMLMEATGANWHGMKLPQEIKGLRILVNWVEDRGGEKVKVNGRITGIIPGGISTPAQFVFEDLSNGRTFTDYVKGKSKFAVGGPKEKKFADGQFKGKAVTLEKVRELI